MVRPLKIWILQDTEPLPIDRGVKKMRMWHLTNMLIGRGHEVIWWGSNFDHAAKKKRFKGDQRIEISSQLTLQLIDAGDYQENVSLARMVHNYRLGERFLKAAIATTEKPDIIVASHPLIEFPQACLALKKNFNIPFIVDARDPWPDSFINYAPSILTPIVKAFIAYLRYKIQKAFASADAIVSMCLYHLQWAYGLINQTVPTQENVFYLGCDEEVAEDVFIEAVECLSSNKVIYTYLGTISKTYDLALVVEAARQLQDNPNIHFVIAGDGPEKASLEKNAADLSNVTFVGWLNKGQSSYLMKKSDVHLMPCGLYTIPNKFFEILFFNKPMISCFSGETAEFIDIKNIGLNYQSGDLEALKKNILSLQDQPTRDAMSANAARLYKEKFSSDMIYENYAKLIERTYQAHLDEKK